MNKEMLFWLVVTLSASAALGYLLGQSDGEPLSNTATERHAVADLCVGRHGTTDDPLVAHYHADISISVNGEFVEIPASVGLNDGDCPMRSLHTHDDTGHIHLEFREENVEAPLEAFFDIWGKHMDATGFDDYRVDDNHEFVMFVTEKGGQRSQVYDFESLIFKDGQKIELVYREKA